MKRLLPLVLLLAATTQAQTPHALGTGKTSMSVTLANQIAGATNFVFVGWCPSNCSSGSTLNSPVTVTDSAGSVYTSVYRTDGPSSNQVFIAPTVASASNVISVSIPASNSSVVMASQVPGLWTVDTESNSGDLMYAVFIGTDAVNYLAGSGFTRLNAGTWWTDEFSTSNLTATFLHNGVTASPTFSVPFKPNSAVTPPILDTIVLSTQVKVCASVCDGTDDSPETGTLVVAQQKLTQSFGFNSDGTIAARFGIDTSVDPADFIVSLSDAPGSLEYKIPQSVLANGASIGTLTLPPLRIQKTSSGIVFKGFVTP